MGGVAALARAAGFRVTGSDSAVYPPMSTQLRDLGIEIYEGFDAAQLDPAPDCIVVGNAMTRGNEAVEAMLDLGLPSLDIGTRQTNRAQSRVVFKYVNHV